MCSAAMIAGIATASAGAVASQIECVGRKISAEVDGMVVGIETQNATLVEFGQALVIIAKD